MYILNIIAPVFILSAMGFIWVRVGFDYRTDFITKITMNLFLPCLIFVALMKTDLDAAAISSTFWASIVVYALITPIFFILLRVMGLDLRTFWPPMIFSNTGNLGLPLAFFAFGEVGLAHAIIVFAVMVIYSFSIGIWMVAGRASLIGLIKEPVVWGTILGAVFMVLGWQTPVFLTNSLELAGQPAIPLMLVTLGVALARLKIGDYALTFFLSVIKYAICLGVALAVGLWFGLDKLSLSILVLQISTPVAVTSYLLAERYGSDSQKVAGLVVASTGLYVVILPILLVFMI